MSKQQRIKPPVSDEMLARIKKEASDLIDQIEECPPSTGESMFVSYSSEFRTKHQIGRFGRVTMKDDERVYHAAPSAIKNNKCVSYFDHNFMDWCYKWLSGDVVDIPSNLLEKSPDPIVYGTVGAKSIISHYETALFTLLSSSYQITLVNPSFSTMETLARNGGGYVTFSTTDNAEWVENAKQFCRQSNGRLVFLSGQQKGICYLGTNDPKIYPLSTPWVRLALSPSFDASSYFNNYRVQFFDDCVMTEMEKHTDYVTVSTLSLREKAYVYNAPTLDKLLSLSKKAFHLVSSIEMSVTPIEDTRLYHRPWFVNYNKDICTTKEENGRVFYVDEESKLVHDVNCTGVYVSRRNIRPPEGYSWISLCTAGTHVLTYSMNVPQVLKEFQYDEGKFNGVYCQIFQFGNCVPTHGVTPKIITRKETSFNQDLGIEVTKDITVKVYEMDDKEICWENNYHHSGVIYTCDLSKGYLTGKIHTVSVYNCAVGTYLDVSKLVIPDGHSTLFVFPDRQSFTRSGLICSVYFSNHHFASADFAMYEKNAREEQGYERSETPGKVRDYLASFPIMTVHDTVPNVFAVASVIDLPAAIILEQLIKMPDFCVWSLGSGNMSSSFCLIKNLKIRFDGKKVDDLACLSGRTWKSVYRAIQRGRTQFFIPKSDLARDSLLLDKFTTFCEYNLIYVRSKRGTNNITLAITSKYG